MPVLPFQHAVISCAGLGSRLGRGLPKCLIDIGGKTLLARQLELLDDVAEVRIVVGFRRDDVMAEALRRRPDAVFIHNDIYDKSTNAYSLHLATHDLQVPFVMLDGDVLLRPDSFRNFLRAIRPGENLLGVTATKTEGPIFAAVNDDGYVTGFGRRDPAPHEWCGIAYISDISFGADGGFACDEITPRLPLRACDIDCYEIDTLADYMLAEKALAAGGF